MTQPWQAMGEFVVRTLENLEDRVKALEEKEIAGRLETQRIALKGSFWGSFTAMLAVAIPAIIAYFLTK